MSKTRTSLHLTCCDCPHVNLTIARGKKMLARFATSADEAEKIAAELVELAAEYRSKQAARLGRAN